MCIATMPRPRRKSSVPSFLRRRARRSGEKPLPQATPQLPGTPEKVAVLAARYRAGQQLWNQAEDAKMTSGQHQRDGRINDHLARIISTAPNGSIVLGPLVSQDGHPTETTDTDEDLI